jgi:hypothetical protein
VTLMIAGRYPESVAQFKKVLDRDPSFAPAHYKLSQLFATTGQFGQAESEFQQFEPAPGSWSADAKGYSRLTLAAPSPGGQCGCHRRRIRGVRRP